MNLKEAIEDLQTGTKHYKFIVMNQNSKDCIDECKSLDFEDILKVDTVLGTSNSILSDHAEIILHEGNAICILG